MNEIKQFLTSIQTQFRQKRNWLDYLSIGIISLNAISFVALTLGVFKYSQYMQSFLDPITALNIIAILGFPIPLLVAVLGLLVSPSLKHKKQIKNIIWLKNKADHDSLYKLYLLHSYSATLTNLAQVQSMIKNIETKTVPNDFFDYLITFFSYHQKKKVSNSLIQYFSIMPPSILNLPNDELEEKLKEKITNFIHSSAENETIETFLNQREKENKKTMSLSI